MAEFSPSATAGLGMTRESLRGHEPCQGELSAARQLPWAQPAAEKNLPEQCNYWGGL